MAEIELYEQLMPVMNTMARASVARRQINYHHDESSFPVEIPRALIEAAGDALAAEIPAP
jgi:CRISPR/Cas system-associated exonuclease Cas4 (RecB family)